MLVSRISCPECDAVLRPSSPKEEGVKVKCSKCGCTFTVRAPREDGDDDDDDRRERRTAGRASALRSGRDDDEDRGRRRRDEDDEDDRGRRRARDEDEDDRGRRGRDEHDDEDDSPRPARRLKKKSGGGGGVLTAVLIGGGVLAALAIITVVVFLVVSGGKGSPAQARAGVVNEATALLAGVKDQAGAQDTKPRLVAVGERLHKFHLQDKAALEEGLKKMRDNPKAIEDAIKEAMRNPDKGKAQMEKMEAERRPYKEAITNLTKEATRVAKVPGGKELLDSFFSAWGEEGALIRMAVNIQDKVGGVVNPPGGGKLPLNPPGGINPPGGFGKQTKENYNRITVGMTEQQVTEILGQPAFTHPERDGGKSFQYPLGHIFFKGGKVTRKFPEMS